MSALSAVCVYMSAMGIVERMSRSPWLSAASSPAAPTLPPAQVASPWSDPSVLQTATLAGLFDVACDQLPVTRGQAIGLPAVARGRDLIATSVARLDYYAATSDGRLASQPRIITRPEMGRARFLTMLWTVDDLIFHGWACWLVTQRYAEDGRPMTCRYVPLSKVDTDPTTGEVVRVFGSAVGPFDVIRFDGPHEGILSRGAQAIRDARALHRTYGRAARTPNPDVELHQVDGEPMTREQVNQLVSDWVTARQAENGGVAYTNKSVQAIFHGSQPQDLLAQGRKDADLDLARVLNLPAWATDSEVGGSSLTYQNVPSRSRELIDYTLAGYIEALTSRLSLDDVLPNGTVCECSTDVLTDGTFLERMQGYQAATDAGVYTTAELSARERTGRWQAPEQTTTPSTAGA